MSADDQEQTVNNIANSMHGVKDNIVQRQLGVFKHVDESLAKRVEDLLKMKKSK
jgi:catalase